MNIFRLTFILHVLLSFISCAEDSREELQLEVSGPITFEGNVRQIIAQDCLNCHTNPPRNGAPFPLETFEEVMNRRVDIRNSINGRTILMPPGRRLSQPRIDIIETWIEQGFLEN